MTATIPFGRRRLVLSVAAESIRSRAPEPGAALGASDAELVRLTSRRSDVEQARWDVWLSMYGGPR
jgi:hypothetical protein